ncbi:MAG: T9SS type A sorting domain-containing protein [Bacteroidia bacterium]
MKTHIFAAWFVLFGQLAFGQTWTQIPQTVSNNLSACWFSPLHPDTGYISGYSPIGGHAVPYVYKTTDGGMSLSYQSVSLGLNFLNPGNITFVNDATGYLAGWGMIKTSDYGINWNITLDMGVAGGLLWDVQFISSDTGYCVGQSFLGSSGGAEGQFLTTYDAGGTWTSYFVSSEVNGEATELKEFARINANDFLVGGINSNPGGPTLFISHDEGHTWTTLNFTENIFSMTSASQSVVYIAAESGIYSVSQNGTSISLVAPFTNSQLTSIRIKDSLGFATAYDGTILASGDNGNSWFQMISPVQGTAVLNQVCILNRYEAWAVGGAGTILHYNANSLPVSVSENVQHKGFTLSPVPANNNLRVHFSGEQLAHDANYEIKSMQGQLIQGGRLNSSGIIEIGTLKDGVYSVQIYNSSGSLNSASYFIKSK